MSEITWRQLLLRNKLEAYERHLDSCNTKFPNTVKFWMQKRHDIIEELNRVQLEEWNYD